MVRRTRRRSWKSGQEPQILRMTSRYYVYPRCAIGQLSSKPVWIGEKDCGEMHICAHVCALHLKLKAASLPCAETVLGLMNIDLAQADPGICLQGSHRTIDGTSQWKEKRDNTTMAKMIRLSRSESWRPRSAVVPGVPIREELP
jgi:hypothetical protein